VGSWYCFERESMATPVKTTRSTAAGKPEARVAGWYPPKGFVLKDAGRRIGALAGDGTGRGPTP